MAWRPATSWQLAMPLSDKPCLRKHHRSETSKTMGSNLGSEYIHLDALAPAESIRWPGEFGDTPQSGNAIEPGKRRREREDQDERGKRHKRDRRVDSTDRPDKSYPVESEDAPQTHLDRRQAPMRQSHRTEGHQHPGIAKPPNDSTPLLSSTRQHSQSIAKSLQVQSLAIKTLGAALDARTKTLQHDLHAALESIRVSHRRAREEHSRAVEEIRSMVRRLSEIIGRQVEQDEGPLIGGWEGTPWVEETQRMGMDYTLPQRDTSGIDPLDCYDPRLTSIPNDNDNNQFDMGTLTPDQALFHLFTHGNDFTPPPMPAFHSAARGSPSPRAAEEEEKTQAEITQSVRQTCERFPLTLAEALDPDLTNTSNIPTDFIIHPGFRSDYPNPQERSTGTVGTKMTFLSDPLEVPGQLAVTQTSDRSNTNPIKQSATSEIAHLATFTTLGTDRTPPLGRSAYGSSLNPLLLAQ